MLYILCWAAAFALKLFPIFTTEDDLYQHKKSGFRPFQAVKTNWDRASGQNECE